MEVITMPGELKNGLRPDLALLKSRFTRGHNFNVRALPGQFQHGESGELLSVEIVYLIKRRDANGTKRDTI